MAARALINIPKGAKRGDIIEIKTLVSSDTLFTALVDGDHSAYIDQINGAMWLLGRKWCDLILWAPDLEAIGQEAAKGITFVMPAYNDMNAEAIAWSKRRPAGESINSGRGGSAASTAGSTGRSTPRECSIAITRRAPGSRRARRSPRAPRSAGTGPAPTTRSS